GFDELGEKGCLWVTVGDGCEVEAEFLPLSRRRYRLVEVDLTGAETPEAALTAALPADAGEDVLRFVLTGESGLGGGPGPPGGPGRRLLLECPGPGPYPGPPGPVGPGGGGHPDGP